MSGSPSTKQHKHPEILGKINFPWSSSKRESPADTLPVHTAGRTGRRYPGTDIRQPFGNLEEEAERRSKRWPGSFSFFPGRLKDLPSLDDALFCEAKIAQSRPNWPGSFDVPEDNGPRDHAALRASTLQRLPHLLAADTEGRKFYQGGKQRLGAMKRKKVNPAVIKHVQGTLLTLHSAKKLNDMKYRYGQTPQVHAHVDKVLADFRLALSPHRHTAEHSVQNTSRKCSFCAHSRCRHRHVW